MATGPIELMAKARAGERDALGELCALYRNYLRMIVRTGLGPKLRERVELSDVVQEALVEVVRQFPQFTGQNEAALVGWLRRLVGQKLADLGRYHSRAKRSAGGPAVPLDAPWEAGAPADSSPGGGRLLDMLALSQTSPSEAASRRELIVLLADALAGLHGDRGRGALALLCRRSLVRGDRRARGPEPQVDPGDLGARPEESQADARQSAVDTLTWGKLNRTRSDRG